jgi:NAD+ synthase/NAD+ synthase (glutamine-hydrolysing)
MKVLIAQLNTTPRDFNGNLAQIKMAIEKGIAANVDLIVTPEASINGYGSKDCLYSKNFIEAGLSCLQDIVSSTKGHNFTLVVGYFDYNHTGVGKPFRNMAAVIKNGKIVATYAKHLLPFYDVFDEGRYFEPGKELTVVKINGEKWAICICEDCWADKGQDDYNYTDNPLAAYQKIGVTNVISLNSSPFVQGKPQVRWKMLRQCFKKGTIIYVNQIGGQDDLVFDGQSMIIQDGVLTYLCKETMNLSFDVAETKSNNYLDSLLFKSKSVDDSLFDVLILGLRDYVRKSGFTDVVVGSSGGIDSAVVIALACEAFGPEHVHGIRMPSVYSSEHSKNDAKQLHENLRCWDYLFPIEHESLLKSLNNCFLQTNKTLGKYNTIADQNIQARIRCQCLMHFANAFGALVLGTGNKSELAVGYFTLYGDSAAAYSPINDLYKMQVYALAKHINKKALKEIIPQNILNKAPSAELAPGQVDESDLLPYPILDQIIKAYVEFYVSDFNEFLTLSHDDKIITEWCKSKNAFEKYQKMIGLIDRSEFKRRQLAPGIKVSRVAFGTGRRLPIVKG